MKSGHKGVVTTQAREGIETLEGVAEGADGAAVTTQAREGIETFTDLPLDEYIDVTTQAREGIETYKDE